MKKKPSPDALTDNLTQLKTDQQTKNQKAKKGIQITDRVMQKSHGESDLLKAFALRIKPLGVEYAGSVCLNFYQNINGQGMTKVVVTGMNNIPESFMQLGIKELTKTVIHKYGHKVPVQRGESYLNKNESDKDLV